MTHPVSCNVMTGGPAGRPPVSILTMESICDQARNEARLPLADEMTNCLRCPALRRCDELQRATTHGITA
jgi:hypothetical protein